MHLFPRLLPALFVISCLICTGLASDAEILSLAPYIRAVDDVAPALRNATTSALTSAQNIVSSSSEFLIAAAIPVGAISTFFGYFLLGPVLFTTAFLVGGGACFVSVRAGLSQSEASAWLSVIAMMVGGGFSGFAACRMLAVGMFAVGACLGVATSAALKVILWSRVFPSSPHAGFIFGAAILGILFGFLALSLRKQMLILSTSYAGSFAMFFGIGHFAGHFPTLRQLDQVERGMFDPWAFVYLGLTALFGTAGMFLQLHLTRDKQMHSHAPYQRRRRLHRRLRMASNSSDWTMNEDAEWERELLAAESRIERESMYSNPRHLQSQVAGRQVPQMMAHKPPQDVEAPPDSRSSISVGNGRRHAPWEESGGAEPSMAQESLPSESGRFSNDGNHVLQTFQGTARNPFEDLGSLAENKVEEGPNQLASSREASSSKLPRGEEVLMSFEAGINEMSETGQQLYRNNLEDNEAQKVHAVS